MDYGYLRNIEKIRQIFGGVLKNLAKFAQNFANRYKIKDYLKHVEWV